MGTLSLSTGRQRKYANDAQSLSSNSTPYGSKTARVDCDQRLITQKPVHSTGFFLTFINERAL